MTRLKEMIKHEEGVPEAPAVLNEAIVVDIDDEDDFMISQMTQGSVESQMTMELNLFTCRLQKVCFT